MLHEERPLSTLSLHLGQRLERKITFSKTFMDPIFSFAWLGKQPLRWMWVKNAPAFFPSHHLFQRALPEIREIHKGINPTLHNNITY